jgi:hypothetical protein
LWESISTVPQEVLSTFAIPVVNADWGAPLLEGVTEKVHAPPSSKTPVTKPPTRRPPVEGSTVASDTCADAPLRTGDEGAAFVGCDVGTPAGNEGSMGALGDGLADSDAGTEVVAVG